MYFVCSCLAAFTHLLASHRPPVWLVLLTAFSHVVQLPNVGDVRMPQCRNSPACASRSHFCRSLSRSADAGREANPTTAARMPALTALALVLVWRMCLSKALVVVAGAPWVPGQIEGWLESSVAAEATPGHALIRRGDESVRNLAVILLKHRIYRCHSSSGRTPWWNPIRPGADTARYPMQLPCSMIAP